mmetsp:Transcript_52315/g.83523  ORF Transcript_52315/g.83523 Transcript_52315/m.83523 type:complete len:633 (-) Transcript_52315:73-1971(-)
MTLRLISLALWGRVLAAECPSGNCDDDNVLMQMDKFHKGMTSAQHKLISDKIEKAFANIKGQGSYLGKTSPSSVIDSKFSNITGLGGYNPHDVKADATWQKCTAINWTKVAGEPTMEGKLSLPSVQMMLEELELQDHCACPGPWCNDDTCKAVFAAIDVFTELCASEFDPVFANYSVTTWGYYPSWVVGSVHGLNYAAEMPVKVTLKHPKGVCGYAVCDLLRTILTQSANQMMTGTCSYVASLAALSKKAPAKAIKIAVRLFWLGEITPGLAPCPGILEQQPGLIPFKTKMGWKPSFYSGGSGECHGNSADCGHASGMPSQNIGLTFEWSQTLISKWMAINWGYCSNDTVRTGVTYPGQSKEDAAMATRNQGGWYNSMVWECQSLFDLSESGPSSCRLVINPLTCALGVDMAPLCKEKWSKELAFPVMHEVFQWDIMEILSEAYEKGIVSEEGQESYVLPALKAKYADDKYAKVLEYIHLLESLAETYQTNWLRLNDLAGPPYPSFTIAELNQTCEAHINMLIIDATVLQVAFSNPEIIYQLKLQKLPAFGNYGLPEKSYGCNHAVFLSECDYAANEYTIWTWGTSVKLTREILLGYPTTQRGYHTAPDSYLPAWNTGALCAAVIADKVNVH